MPAPHSELDYSPIAESRRPSAGALGTPTPASDIFLDVLVSLKSILSPGQFEVLEHELAAFSEEYRHKHYTACALRLGRTTPPGGGQASFLDVEIVARIESDGLEALIPVSDWQLLLSGGLGLGRDTWHHLVATCELVAGKPS
jgi:hypothetical protein